MTIDEAIEYLREVDPNKTLADMDGAIEATDAVHAYIAPRFSLRSDEEANADVWHWIVEHIQCHDDATARVASAMFGIIMSTLADKAIAA